MLRHLLHEAGYRCGLPTVQEVVVANSELAELNDKYK